MYGVMDQLGCRTLTGWKRGMGMPWSFVLEFHGWWHIFTGIGAYIFIVLTDVLTAGGSERETTSQVDFGWPANWVIGNTAVGQTASVHINGSVVEVDVKTD